jgi:CRISPR-associated protein Cas2
MICPLPFIRKQGGQTMFVLVSYDVSTTDTKGSRRLNRVAKACKDYGQRVQYSVFECIVDPAQWAVLKQRLIDEIDQELDSLRFYYLGSNWRRRVEHIGAKKTIDQEGPLVV